MTNFESVKKFMEVFGQEVKTKAECFDEVQRSNMSKLGDDGKPIYNDQGKVMKGPKYFQPDLSKFIK